MGLATAAETQAVEATLATMTHGGRIGTLMVVCGAGYLAVSVLFVLLHAHAWRRRDALELDAGERGITARHLQAHGIFGGVALLSIALSLAGRRDFGGLSYFPIGPLRGAHGWMWGRRRDRASAR